MTHLCPRAVLVTVIFATLVHGQGEPPESVPNAAPTSATIDALVAAADFARSKGEQASFVACGYRLRNLWPADPLGHFVLAIGHASLGPRFAKDVALHAFARFTALVQEPLAAEVERRLLDFADVRQRGGLAGLRKLVRQWQHDLEGGQQLLLVPDRAALVQANNAIARRVDKVAGWVASERSKLERLRRRKKAAEQALQREQTRKRRLGEAMIDLQPFVDRITSSARAIGTSERRLAQHERDLAALRPEAKRLSQRARELQ